MYLSFIHPIISTHFFMIFYQLVVSSNQNIIPSEFISNDIDHHHLPTMINNNRQNQSLYFILRMIIFSKKPKHSSCSTTKQDSRILLLPIMIRMLFEGITQRTNDRFQSINNNEV